MKFTKDDFKTVLMFGVVIGSVSAIVNKLVTYFMDKHNIPQQLFGDIEPNISLPFSKAKWLKTNNGYYIPIKQ